MSQESMQTLNTDTLIGFTDERGMAWHYRAEMQGELSNHYPQAIPVEDVRKRLFHWKAAEGDITSTVITENGVLVVKDPSRKTIVRPDTMRILGIFKRGYLIHDFDEWLIKNVEAILGDELAVSSAGLLKGGAVAWVEVSVPKTIVTPEGVEFRPNILAATSLDGSLSSTYARTIQNTVCDNTLAAALTEPGQKIKVKHSRNSLVRLADVQEALNIVHTMADDFAAQVAQLCNTTVTDAQWDKFLAGLAPTTDEKGEEKTGRGLTLATKKQDTLRKMWNTDARVEPWKNTAWGVLQAVNTATHHEFDVRLGEDGTRAERNMLRAVTGETEKTDLATMNLLAGVLA